MMKSKRTIEQSLYPVSLPPRTHPVIAQDGDFKTGQPPPVSGYRPWKRGSFEPSDDDYRLLKMVSIILFIGVISTFLAKGRSQLPSQPTESPLKGTSLLDHDALLAGFLGRTFLKDNIPFIDIPDKLIQDVYYYRWSSLQHNLRYVMQNVGWMCTEFVHPVWYASAYGAIDAAAGHHFDEMRWLRSTYYADDYFQLYARGPANSTQYSQWILDAVDRRSMVTGHTKLMTTHLDDMVRMWHRWDSLFDKDAGLFYIEPVWDAQELSLPGWIVDPNATHGNLRNDGPDTYRPSHNTYMVANARAIARAARLAGNEITELEFTDLADNLESSLHNRLWDPVKKFFMDVIRPNNPHLKQLTGREQVGLFPFRFGIGLDEEYAQPAVDAMLDPEGFLAPYGPTTLEIRDPWFMGEKPDNYCRSTLSIYYLRPAAYILRLLVTIAILTRSRLLLEWYVMAILNKSYTEVARRDISCR